MVGDQKGDWIFSDLTACTFEMSPFLGVFGTTMIRKSVKVSTNISSSWLFFVKKKKLTSLATVIKNAGQ